MHDWDDETAKNFMTNLRSGQPPKRNLDKLAVGIENFWQDLQHEISLIDGTDNGLILYLMADFGEGKTFLCNYLMERLSYERVERKYVCSYVEGEFKVLADKIKIYRKIVNNIKIPSESGDKFGLRPLFDKLIESFDNEKKVKEILRKENVRNDIIEKILKYYRSHDKEYDPTDDVVIRWFSGDDNIKADPHLHSIDEKGFAKIEGDDVNHYLTAINSICKICGYAGLMVLFDEAEQRTTLDDEHITTNVLENLKHFHNKLTNDSRFSQMIFVLAGTEDLWEERSKLDQAQKERLESHVRKTIPNLEIEDYFTLGKKILSLFDKVFGKSISIDLIDAVKDEMIYDFIEKKDYETPRDFILSFIDTLEQIRKKVRANQKIDKSDLESYFN